MVWSDNIWKRANKVLRDKLDSPLLAIHLRNGDDFKSACNHVQEGRNFFGSAQCLGYNNEKGFLSQVGPSDQGRDVIYADAIEGEGLILSSICGLLGNMLSLCAENARFLP